MNENILGYRVSTASTVNCCRDIIKHLQQGERKRWLACLNPHSFVVALSDAAFSKALHQADLLIPDGTGIVLASRTQGGQIKERVTGSDIFLELSSQLNAIGGHSVFFLGSTHETLDEIKVRISRDYPAIHVAGVYSPPFKPVYSDVEIQQMVAAINAVKPDVLWVGMTAPKQEKWIDELLPQLDFGFAAAVGAVFDFYTDKVKRSPEIFCRLGLEWLPRLLQEPRRLWRRNFISSPIFLLHLLRALINKKRLGSKI